MKSMLLTGLFFSVLSAQSQIHYQLGSQSYGMANTGLCAANVWATFNNPGALGMVEKTSLGLSAENRFLIKELSSQALGFVMHTNKTGNFGFHFQQYGFELYREMNGAFSYGMKLSEQFAAGISMQYHGIFLADNYGSKTSFSAALGMVYSPTKNLSLGVRVLNVNRARLAEFDNERLPTVFGLGFEYRPTKKVTCVVEAEKDMINPLNVKAALAIQAHEIFSVRMGMNTYPFISSFGFGIQMKKFMLDGAAQWHTKLGLCPAFSLVYSFE